MDTFSNFKALGFSQYEAACYMTLVSHHPVNGSQLSKLSGIARSRIYDVIRNLTAKGYVIEVSPGQYAPLPGDELVRRLRQSYSDSIDALEAEIEKARPENAVEYVWTITGYDQVLEKASQMIQEAQKEIYVRLFPEAGRHLEPCLLDAEKRGVNIRYIAMGDIPKKFDIQVTHPNHDRLKQTIGGRSIDVISDKAQALVGIFETGNEDLSPVNWTRNPWFIIANRDSLRHDFYHCFLEKILDRNQTLTAEEERIYTIIKKDD